MTRLEIVGQNILDSASPYGIIGYTLCHKSQAPVSLCIGVQGLLFVD